MTPAQALWIITASIAVFAIARANDEKWPRKFPFNFRNLVNKQELCESGYTDYESCDNYISNGLAKRYAIFVKNRFSLDSDFCVL